MNEEKVKRGRGRPVGGVSHIGIQASDLAKYCADHPNETVMVSRVFWEKNALVTDGLAPVKRTLSPENVAESDTIVRETASEWVTPLFALGSVASVNEVSDPKIEMTLSE
jgi:hypothetical protein